MIHKMLLLVTVLLSSCAAGPPRPVEIACAIGLTGTHCGTTWVAGYDGSGTILITAYHVVEDALAVYVMTRQNATNVEMVSAELMYYDEDVDQAIIRVDGRLDGQYKTCVPYKHEQIVIPARLRNGDWDHDNLQTGYRLQYGIILDLKNDHIVMDARVEPGYSGAPVISVERNCVVGVVTQRILDSRLSIASRIK